MAAAPSVFEQLLLSEIRGLVTKFENLSTKVDNIQHSMGANAASTTEALSKVIHNEIVANAPAAREKKKVVTVDGAAGAGAAGTTEEKKVAQVKTHPSLPNVTEAAWGLKKTGDNFAKRLDWFICVLTKHPAHIHPIIGTEEVKRIESSPLYASTLAKGKKQGDREKAKAFLSTLESMQTAEGKFAELSKKLVADYDTQLGVLNSQKIGQLTAETPSAAEIAAASAIGALGTPVTVHTTTATNVTTTSPAAQLATV